MALWQAAKRFDPSNVSERTFVTMIARRTLIDGYSTRRARLGRDGDVQAGTEHAASVSDEAKCAADILAELGIEDRKVIRMSLDGSMTHSEIAEATGIPIGTVKTRIRRGLQGLRDRLKGRSAEGSRLGGQLSAHAREMGSQL